MSAIVIRLKVLYFIFILTVCGLFSCQPQQECLESEPKIVKPNPHLAAFINKLDKCIEDTLKRYPAPGFAICVVKDSSVVYMKCFGEKIYGSGDSINPHTAFKLASVSKPMAALLASTYVKDGFITWDEPVINFLPWFKLSSPYQTRDLQIKHILSHTAGVPYHALTNYIEYGECLDTMIHMLRDSVFDSIAPVGTIYSYQNVTYSIIEKVMESITGNVYEEMIENRLFCPLGMTDASVTFEGLVADSNYAQPHIFYNGTWTPVKIKKTYYNAKPAGGVNASISDMAMVLVGVLGHRPDILSPEVLSEMYEPIVRTPIKYKYFNSWDSLQNLYYGMGFRVLHTTYDTLVYHGGYANSYRSELAFSPKNNIGVSLLANSPAMISYLCIPAFFDLYEQYADSINNWSKTEHMKIRCEE